MTNTALLDKIFPSRVIDRFLEAHIGETFSTAQIMGARALPASVPDPEIDTICELCRLAERKRVTMVGSFLWRRGEQETLMLTPANSTIDNPICYRTQVWCAGKRLPVDEFEQFEMLPVRSRGAVPERCYLSYQNRTISFWPEVDAPVEIVVKGFREA